MPKLESTSISLPVPPGVVEPAAEVPPNAVTGDVTPVGNASDRVARRALELYEQRGGTHGFDQEDWLQAEHELLEGEQELEHDGHQ